MKVLVVDDMPSKISKVISILSEECGMDRGDIVVAQNAFDAKKHLSSTSFVC